MRERILIVEDDPTISKLIDTNLALSGYQTVCAMDGKQAVDAIQAKAWYTLILSNPKAPTGIVPWEFDMSGCGSTVFSSMQIFQKHIDKKW